MSDSIETKKDEAAEDEAKEEEAPKRGFFGRLFGRKADDRGEAADTGSRVEPETDASGVAPVPGGEAERAPEAPAESDGMETEPGPAAEPAPEPEPRAEEAEDEPRKGFLGRLFGRGPAPEEGPSVEEPGEEAQVRVSVPEEEAAAEPAPEAPGGAAGQPEGVPPDLPGKEPGPLEDPDAPAGAPVGKPDDDGSKVGPVDPPQAKTGSEGVGEEDEEKGAPRAGFFGRLRKGLSKTRSGFVQRVDRILLGKKEIDAETLEELEEALVTADLGVNTVMGLIDDIQERVARKELASPEALREHLKAAILDILLRDEAHLAGPREGPMVIMVVGVNGVGKTTTIGKIAARYARDGKKVVLGAGDTFRAAAVEQLEVWGRRVGAQVIRHQDGSDPAAVAFDAVEAAKARGADVVIIDTAGRLHTKKNLMEELKKVRRVIGKALPGAPHQVLLVLDATTGQNAVSQAKLFHEAVGVDTLALTKLDGTAKGGVVVAVSEEVPVPIAYIGVGEQVDDLRPFEAESFVDALFERSP